MATESISLSNKWVQVTDGTAAAIIQCTTGKFALCFSDLEPPESQPFHLFTDFNVPDTFSVWVKSFTPGSKLIVSKM